MEAVRALFLTGLLVACAAPTGAAGLRAAGLEAKDTTSRLERWLLAVTAGLGLFALAFTLAGLTRTLRPPRVLVLPLLAALATLPVSRGFLWGVPWTRPAPGGPDRLTRRLAVGAMLFIALAVVVQDLAPPTDYDGLLYHLVAPRAFLTAGMITYIPHNFSANLPALGEMLYAFGLAGGSDRAPQLLHAVAGALAVGLTYTFGTRLFGARPALWGAAGLAATPLVPFLATRAYIDLFTVLFGLVALGGVLVARDTGRPAWLRIAGAATGLAIATKYSAFTLGAVLGAAVLLAVWHRTRRPGPIVQAGIVFGGLAALFALPWYARQIVALHNPVWPMVFGGRDWDAVRVEQLTYFVDQYGTGHGWRDWLLLPWNVYTQSWRFGHVPDAFPPLLAVAAPLAWLWGRERGAAGGAARWLLWITVAASLFWARGWLDLRFLLTLYPALALLGAAGLEATLGRRRPGALLVSLGVAWLCLVTAARQVERAADAVPVVTGREPVAGYLGRRLTDFAAVSYLNAQVPPGQAVLFLGDGQIWYCRPRCVPDPAHDNLLQWFVRPGDLGVTREQLQRDGVTHILLSKVDYWYLEHQDPDDRLRRQLNEFYRFKAEYLDLVYQDAATEIYRGRW
jgi:hypothetical protein